MPRTQLCSSCSFLRAIRATASLCLFLLACASPGFSQTAVSLSQVKKVYVQPFGLEIGAAQLHDRVVEKIRQKGTLEIVAAPNHADAVIKGTGSIWLAGYVSNSPRSSSATRQPLYHGFLSVEVLGNNNEPLWSYLVTPNSFGTNGITKDLADRLVAKLFAALEQKSGPLLAPPAAGATDEVTLIAAGATFPAPLYQKWFESFEERHPNVHIRYNPVGSGAGLQLLADGKLDFAASDMPLSDERTAQSNKPFRQFVTVIGAVVPVYNLKGTDSPLNFTPEVLAGIFSGKIKKWNDPAIHKSNRGAALPDADIVVIHRSDGSGTTYVWTDFLSKLSPEWKTSVGADTTVSWPVGTGAPGNEGVAAMVEQTPNSIGYVELVYAIRHQLGYGAVRNSAGRFLQADLASITAAAMDVPAAASSDFRGSITNAAGKGAYPVASFTWWVFPGDAGSESKRSVLRELLQWVLTSGQKDCSALGYVPLPRDMASRQLQSVSNFK